MVIEILTVRTHDDAREAAVELTVFGATGGTGREVVGQALDAGHRVTAVVRDPARIPLRHPALQVVTADVTDSDALRPHLQGRHAAISALGPRSNKYAGIASVATAAILRALDASGPRRFVAVSAAPVGPVPREENFLARRIAIPLVRRAFRRVYADLATMEDEIRSSSAVEWTIVRPPRLLNKPLSGRYRRVVGANVPRGLAISRSDLAHAMLALLEDRATVRQVVGVAY
jgi:putative NADH-flavin reductase